MTEALRAVWWTIPQALVWIVARNAAAVEEAASLRYLFQVERLGITPVAVGDDPPVSLAAAPGEFIRALRRLRVGVKGRNGSLDARLEPVGIRSIREPLFKDTPHGISLTDDANLFPRPVWEDLYAVREHCIGIWPAIPVAQPAQPVMPADDAETEKFKAWAIDENKNGRRITEASARQALSAFPGGNKPGRKEIRRMMGELPDDVVRAKRGETRKI